MCFIKQNLFKFTKTCYTACFRTARKNGRKKACFVFFMVRMRGKKKRWKKRYYAHNGGNGYERYYIKTCFLLYLVSQCCNNRHTKKNRKQPAGHAQLYFFAKKMLPLHHAE